MNCPFCRDGDSRVVDSRAVGGTVRRRRECTACGRRFTTTEQVERRLPSVVKKSGAREAFQRDKVLDGLLLACRKRPVGREELEAATDRVTDRVASAFEREVESRVIGRLVLEELLELDRVAYLRFASVYLELDRPEEFLQLLEPLLERRP